MYRKAVVMTEKKNHKKCFYFIVVFLLVVYKSVFKQSFFYSEKSLILRKAGLTKVYSFGILDALRIKQIIYWSESIT